MVRDAKTLLTTNGKFVIYEMNELTNTTVHPPQKSALEDGSSGSCRKVLTTNGQMQKLKNFDYYLTNAIKISKYPV